MIKQDMKSLKDVKKLLKKLKWMVIQMNYDELMNDTKRFYCVIYYLDNLLESYDSKGVYIQTDNIDMVTEEFRKKITNPYAHITSIECMKSRINFYVKDKIDSSTRFLHTKYKLLKFYKNKDVPFKCIEEDAIIFEQRRKGVKIKR